MALYEELIEVYSDEIEEIKKLDKKAAQAEEEAEEVYQTYLDKIYSAAKIEDWKERQEAQRKSDDYYKFVVAPKLQRAGELDRKTANKRFELNEAVEAEYAHVPFHKTRTQGTSRFFELAFYGDGA